MRKNLSWILCAATALLVGGCECDFFASGDPDGGSRNGGIGAPCDGPLNCRLGLVCDDTATCQPSHTGLEGSVCTLTGDCMAGLYCGPRRTCVPGGEGEDGADCGDTADCVPGLQCVVEGFGFRCRPSGQGDLDAACESSLECVAGLTCVTSPGGARTCGNPAVFEGDGGVGAPPVLPRWTGAECEIDDGTPTAYFQVPRGDETDGDFYRLPFPNDVRRTAGGLDLSGHPAPGDALSTDVLGLHIDAAEQDLDGFATNPVIYFRFSAPYEWGDVTADRLLLVDVTPGSPEYGQNLGRSWLNTGGPITRYICPNWMAMRRGHGAPLRSGTTYAAVLLRGVRTAESEGHVEIERAPDLDALLSDEAPTQAPLTAAYDGYASLREWLALDESPAAAEVLNATVFTTQRATQMVPALREAVRAQAAPSLTDVTVCGDGVTSPCDDGAARVCGASNPDYWEIHARIALPQFQEGEAPFEAPADGGGIRTDTAGAPVVTRTEPVCMVLTVPKVSAAPPEGFPLVVYGHGTGGAFTSVLANGLAGTFATGDGGGGAPNAATVAIDMPLHGTRRGDTTRSPDVLVFNFLNPQASRGNFLQGAADLMSLVYWAETFTLAAADAPTDFDVRFDPTRVAVWGHSQGATHAQLMVPFEPGLVAALLSGAGGDLTESLLTKTQPVNIAAAVPLALLDPAADGTLTAADHHPALALFQMYYEAVDPVNYGRHYLREPVSDTTRHVFMTYGLADSFSTERTLAAFARSVGFPHVSPELIEVGLGDTVAPPVSGNVLHMTLPYTAGMRQYAPEAGSDGHFVATRTAGGLADTTRFLLQALSGAVPAIGE